MTDSPATTGDWSPEMVDKVLAAMRARQEERDAPYPYEALAEWYPTEQVLALMEALEAADISESGVSLRTGWVMDYLPDIEQRIAAFKASLGQRVNNI